MTALHSPTEEYGLSLLSQSDINVMSIGISTAGEAEIRMTQGLPLRRVIATTLDAPGAEQTQNSIAAAGLSDRIEVRIEDIAGELPYADGSFDFIYARLVLHYLSKQQLEQALANIGRILRGGGRLFVVVRSTDCLEAKDARSQYDPSTCLTTYHCIDRPNNTVTRYFHSDTSITDALERHGFLVDTLEHVQEALAFGFGRDKLSTYKDDLIQLVAHKKE